MTVTATNRKNSFPTNGVTVDFPFTFAVTTEQQVKALTRDAQGVETEYTNFTIALNPSTEGGTLTTGTTLNDVTLVVYRDTPLTQQTDYVPGGRFPAESHEAALDKLTLQNQDQQEEIDRSLKSSISDVNPPSLEEYDATVDARDAATLASANDYTNKQVFEAGTITPDSLGGLTNYQAASVADMIAGITQGGVGVITPELINSNPITIKTTSYYKAVPTVIPMGGASYLCDTINNIRLYLSSAIWVPDGFGSHYMFNGTEYAALLIETVRDITMYGSTVGSSDDSASVNAMLADVNYIYVPSGYDLHSNNLELTTGSRVVCDGNWLMASGAVDFDRLMYADQKSDISITINGRLDGNKENQSGDAGTHLIYIKNSPKTNVYCKWVGKNYFPRTFHPSFDDGGIRTSSGAVYLYKCPDSNAQVDIIEAWGREGLYLNLCESSVSRIGKGIGTAWEGGDEYSGLQQSGDYSHCIYANVEGAGASNISFDVRYGTAGTFISKNARFFHGVNFGHSGVPSTGSVIDSIISDGCDENSVNVTARTEGLTIGSMTALNGGVSSFNVSSGAKNIRVNGGLIRGGSAYNINTFDTDIYLTNVDASGLYDLRLYASSFSGTFQNGETVTGDTSGATATLGRSWNSTNKFLMVDDVSGTFQAGETVTGSASGATIVIDSILTPAPYRRGGTTTEYFSQVRLSPDPMSVTFVPMSGASDIVVNNGNVRSTFLPIISPSNASGAQALPYLKSVSDGVFTVGVPVGAGGGAGFRYDLY